MGTKKHRDKYFDGIDNVDYPGCFAMTELHHGKLFCMTTFVIIVSLSTSILYSLVLVYEVSMFIGHVDYTYSCFSTFAPKTMQLR